MTLFWLNLPFNNAVESQLNLSFQSEKTMTHEDVPDCSEGPHAFGSMEFSDAASLFEESPLEEFILNTRRTKQVFKE